MHRPRPRAGGATSSWRRTDWPTARGDLHLLDREHLLAARCLVEVSSDRDDTLEVFAEARMDRSRAVGATAVFSRVMGGKTLTFDAVPDGFRDRETGTLWNLLGHAIRGPIADRRLRAIPHVDAFWFAWAAFHPVTTIHSGP